MVQARNDDDDDDDCIGSIGKLSRMLSRITEIVLETFNKKFSDFF